MDIQRHRFLPRPPWIGGTLQTLRGVAWPFAPALPPGHRLWLPLPSGDELAASLHWPPRDRGTARPLALLVHGLTGTEDDPYLRAAARTLLEQGFPVLRLNLRGNAVSAPRSSSQYHVGRAEDLRDALRALPPALTTSGVVCAGWSLGGALVLLMLARHAEEPGLPPLLAGAAICPPLDPLAVDAAIDAHPVFGRPLLAMVRREVLALQGARDLPDRLRVAATHARSLREFDETVTAPRFGYPSAAAFAEVNRADRALPAIRVPTLLLMAEDDSLVPAAGLEAVDWSACPAVAPVLMAGGGHCGFEDARPWGLHPLARHNLQCRAITTFFEDAAAAVQPPVMAQEAPIARATTDQGLGSSPSSSAQTAESTAPA